MQTNEILDEIHRVRAEHAAECGYDVNVIFARMDEDLKRLQAEGWQVVSPAPRGSWEKFDSAMAKVRDVPPLPGDEKETSYALREEPPQKTP